MSKKKGIGAFKLISSLALVASIVYIVVHDKKQKD